MLRLYQRDPRQREKEVEIAGLLWSRAPVPDHHVGPDLVHVVVAVGAIGSIGKGLCGNDNAGCQACTLGERVNPVVVHCMSLVISVFRSLRPWQPAKLRQGRTCLEDSHKQ
ncbi:MAG: hypothetical protein CMM46_08755 [Rhodospirillaceae bacterium]|nr:hypothetical protein [Rhodospirillaceae bacterium]